MGIGFSSLQPREAGPGEPDVAVKKWLEEVIAAIAKPGGFSLDSVAA